MKFQFSYRTNFKFITIIILLVFVSILLLLSVSFQHHQLLREINNNDSNNNIDTSFGHNSAGVVSPTPPQLLQTIKQQQPQPQPPGIAIAIATDNNNEKNNNVNKKTMTTTTATMTDVVDADNENNAINDNDKYNTKGKYAYAMLMAGVDPDTSKLENQNHHLWYRGILFNSMVVSELIHRNNNSNNNNNNNSNSNNNTSNNDSTSDILLMIQFAKETNATKLSDLEEEMLSNSNVKIKYIPKPSHGELNFYTVQLEKFRILQYYQEYSRILFIDGDVMPHCNLDYLFKLSEEEEQGSDSSSSSSSRRNTLLKENIIISGKTEPSSGGFFMLTPKEGDYEQLQEIVTNQQRTALHTGILFDPVIGWGHIITTPDSVLITTKTTTAITNNATTTTLWSWHGDFIDQGLLYYWVKYYKKNVSIIIKNKIQNWGRSSSSSNNSSNNSSQQEDDDDDDDVLILERTFHNNLLSSSNNNKNKNKNNNCDCLTKMERSNSDAFLGISSRDKQLGNYLPYGNFIHFSGREKPWSTWNQDKLDIKNIIHRVEQQKTKKKHRGDGDGEDEDENNGDSDSYYYNPMGFKNPHEIWQYTFWKIFNKKLLPVLLKTTEDNSTSNNTNANTNKDVVLVSKSEREREEERRFQIFHKLLNTIPKPIYGGYPTHWHVQLVIQAKFNQTFIPAILDTNAALQVETKRIIEKEKRQKKLVRRVRKREEEKEEEDEGVIKRH